MPKFAALDAEGNPVPHHYGNLFFRHPCGDTERLVIGPDGEQIKLLDELTATFSSQQFYILYVLLVSHAGRLPGRYQSPLIDHDDLRTFIWTFQNYFEGDGRHHVWIAAPDVPDLLVYDQHDVIFGYGNLDVLESVLTGRGFREQEFWFPSPHSHWYDPANLSAEDELMAFFEWKYFPLQPGDEWD